MWKEAVTAVWLTVLSMQDIKSKNVPVWMLWIGTVGATGAVLWECVSGTINIMGLCKAIIPGVLLTVIAAATGKAGCADGIILMVLGLLTGYEGGLIAALCGLLLIALFSGSLLMFKRVKRDTRIPFVPFLTIGWLMAVCEKGGIF